MFSALLGRKRLFIFQVCSGLLLLRTSVPLLLIFISKGYFFSETPCVPVCDENQSGEREVGEVLVALVAVT